MSKIFENAVTSIILGVEDYRSGKDARLLSAARNYYAGLLLLAKECLIQTASEADAMDVIGAEFKPALDAEGRLTYKASGTRTLDLVGLKKRFKDFELQWPAVNIDRLQKFRNNLEHYHLDEPNKILKEAISSTFPMVVDFFEILKEDPPRRLGSAWDDIVRERKIFVLVQEKCVESFRIVDWPAELPDINNLDCPGCGSSLIGQEDATNKDKDSVIGKCHQCGQRIDNDEIIKMILESLFGEDDHVRVMDGDYPAVADCPECGKPTYVNTEDINVCFSCETIISGECGLCNETLGINNCSWDNPNYCCYCAYKLEKD